DYVQMDLDYTFGHTQVLVSANNGNGTFGPGGATLLDPGNIASGFDVADLNGDGRPDIVIGSDYLGGSLVTFLGAGGASYTNGPRTSTGMAGSAIRALDVDGGGSPDVILDGYDSGAGAI